MTILSLGIWVLKLTPVIRICNPIVGSPDLAVVVVEALGLAEAAGAVDAVVVRVPVLDRDVSIYVLIFI